MFGDSQALFTDSNAIFSSNFSPKGEQHRLLKHKMNFSRSNIQDYSNNKSADSNEDLIGESFKGLDNDDIYNKSVANGFGMNSSLATQMGALDNTYKIGSSMGTDKMVSGLMRQNSSPAGFFSHLSPQSGYAAMRGRVGNYRLGNGSNGDLGATATRLKSQMGLSSGIPSSLGMLSRIPEIDGGNISSMGNRDSKNGNINGDAQYYTSEFPLSSWNDSLHFADNYTGLKREVDEDRLYSSSQNGEIPNRPSLLSHHLSLPKTSNEISCMDKLLQFQESVPCKIRAKRGCATHPRSIAERVRRTRISERMRKLQELVPHMDKQTNTADMLDLAVEYIKDLQKQYKTLSDSRANCKCSCSMQNQGLN